MNMNRTTTWTRLHPPAWMARGYGITAADLAPFAGELRVEGDALLARHRDQAGRELGWEGVTPGAPRPRSDYTAGAQGGSFRGFPARHLPRLVLTNGAAQAIAVSALEGRPARRHRLRRLGRPLGRPGAGHPDRHLLARWGVREIEHAYAAADADLRLYARADTHIVGLAEAGRTGPLVWGPMPAPGGCWLRALREARR